MTVHVLARMSPTLLFALLLAGCASAHPPRATGGDAAPGGAAGASHAPVDEPRRVVAATAAVTTASPYASDAGIAMLRAGGNAVDAAVAAAFAIGVVEPQMSGLGGSGVMLMWHQQDARAEYLDFYAAQNAASFARAAPTTAAAAGAAGADLRIVGIPGAVAGLLEAHGRYGRLPLAQVLAPAIALAEDGFPVGQVLAQFVRSDSARLHRFPAAAAHLWPGGVALGPGDVLRNPDLGRTLRAIAGAGRAGFYEGAVADALIEALSAGGHPAAGEDLRTYEPQWKAPLCTSYRGRLVLSAPPPQTGGQVLQTLKLLEPFDLAQLGLPTRSPHAFDVVVSALRVAMADNHGNEDPRWVDVPVRGRISGDFARLRQALVGTATAPVTIAQADPSAFEHGSADDACVRIAPPTAVTRAPAAGAAVPPDDRDGNGETTHISVVDGAGNAVSLTQTNSSTFGSGAFVAGFFLNDSGYRFDDASLATTAEGWRTRASTIAPTIVLDDGRVRMVTGAPGAGRIPTEVAQTMVYVLDYGLDPLAALRMPRIFPSTTSAAVQLEHGFPADLLHRVRRMGYDPVAQSSSYARIYMIVRTPAGWVAVADPRHDGEPRGF